jgi:hypothetical protein
MRHLLLSVLFVILVSAPAAYAQGLEAFLNISRAIGKEVSVVDRSGLIREGILEAATADAVTLRVGSAGYLLDAAESNRQPLYRAPSASSPTPKVSWRF